MTTTMITKQIMLITVIAVFAISMTVQQVRAESIIGNVADGYDAGKAQGKEDYREGNGWNDSCHPNVGVQYCIGWVSGYNVGYGSMKIAGDFLVFTVQDVQASTGPDDPNTETNENDFAEIRKSCHDQGYEDGQNSPFSRETYNHCGDDNSGGDDAYLEGFMKGCMKVSNTKDVCESATDA